MQHARNPYKICIRKLQGKRPFGRPRINGRKNIKMVLREMGLGLNLSGSKQGPALVFWENSNEIQVPKKQLLSGLAE
jgi:hypothetical protein